MNQREIYREIGEIDENLILEADKAAGRTRSKLTACRIAAMAACLCVILCGIWLAHGKNTVYINETHGRAFSKMAVPGDENAKIITISYQEMLDYFEIKQLPDAFLGEIQREKQPFLILYENAAGNIIYDMNTVYYNDGEGKRTVAVTLAKGEEGKKASGIASGDMRPSKLGGISMVLAAEGDGVYWGSFHVGDVTIKAVVNGSSKEDFVEVMKLLAAGI